MVKNKKALILLLLFLTFFNSPAYPKGKSIKYLPANYTSDTVSEDYKTDPITLNQLDGGTCSTNLSSFSECSKCVKELKGDCPDCCLTMTSPNATRCSSSDTSDDYNCTEAPFTFDVDDCAQTECGLRSGDDATDCETLVCSSGLVSSGSPYGLQRRGCPDADSDELAPNCSSICTVTGTDIDGYRIWSCPASCGPSLSPSFQTCSETSGPPRCDGLGSYYDITYVWENDGTDRKPVGCSSCTLDNSCPSRDPAGDCNSSNATSCSNMVDNVSDSCTYDCNCVSVPVPTCTSWTPPPPPWTPPPPPWTPPPPSCSTTYVTTCDTCTCNGYVECTAKVKLASYTYELNDAFKGCIVACTAYANEYEICEDRKSCCLENICDGEEYDDGTLREAGFDNNCDENKCQERIDCPTCDNPEYQTAGQCAEYASDIQSCLISHPEFFREIKDTSHEGVTYEFTAMSGESLSIIWQVLTKHDITDEGINFYTLVGVTEKGSSVPVHKSMMNVRSLSAAFSTLGTTYVPSISLAPGKTYEVRLYYFLPKVEYCAETYDDYEVKVEYLSLNIVKIKE